LAKGAGQSESLYLDEIALRKGQGNFETVVSTDFRVLTLIKGKSSESLQGFLRSLPGINSIKQVCMDMCSPFAHAVKQVLPKAIIVVDRFHVIQKLNDALEQARKRTHPKLDEQERKRFKRIHFLLGQEYQALHRDEKRLVRDYLRLNKVLKPIYWECQRLRKILFYRRFSSAEQAYDVLWEWCEQARKHLKRFIETLERWWYPVCLFPLSNARQEGINNKIKLVKRQGFGYTNRQTFRLKVLAAFNP